MSKGGGGGVGGLGISKPNPEEKKFFVAAATPVT